MRALQNQFWLRFRVAASAAATSGAVAQMEYLHACLLSSFRIFEVFKSAFCLCFPSQPAPAAEANGQEMGDGFELEDNTLAAEYSEELEFASQKEKDLSDRLLSTAEKAADIAVRALGGLVEAAALVGFLQLAASLHAI